ncbi:hypothetical protein B0H13DRAFT_2300178 [Mycena leptocephala]|nr:hypothetical protein B0H13DRAFT_2300178 [Mycena leptocephala]
MVELAQELIDLITEHTSTENKDSSCSGTWWRPTDHSTLTACALVAKAFVVPSQRCLFRSVELDRQGIMCTVFAQSLILTSYIQDLMIDLDFADNSTLTPLALILPLFQGVHRLVIYSRGHVNGSPSIPVEFRTALPFLLRLPTLRCLGLAHCRGVPASLIHHALLSYKEVVLDRVKIYHENEFLRLSDGVSPSC